MIRNQAAGVWEQLNVGDRQAETVGIVGYGDIGRAVALRAHAMGMHVLATKRRAPNGDDPLVKKVLSNQRSRR